MSLRIVALLLPSTHAAHATHATHATHALEGLAEVCLRWTPQIAVSKEAVFLEISKCHHLYTEKEILIQLQELMIKMNLSFKIGVAHDLSTALAMARFQVSNKEDLPLEALNDYNDPFGTQLKNLNTMINLCKTLGIYKISDLAAYPRKMLASRFGKQALLTVQRLQQAPHSQDWPWPYFHPAESLIERQDIDHLLLTDSFEPIIFITSTLLHRVLERLQGRSQRLLSFNLLVSIENNNKISWNFELPFPQNDHRLLLVIVRERLNKHFSTARERPNETYVKYTARKRSSNEGSIEIHVLQTTPHLNHQQNFLHHHDEEHETWGSLLTRLGERLGNHHSFVALPIQNYLPERSWQKTFKFTDLDLDKDKDKEVDGVGVTHNDAIIPLRPLKILKQPQLVKHIGPQLVWHKRSWKIVKTNGPEKLSGHWWQQYFRRDYYQITTDNKECLWVFNCNGNLYLHGFFD